MESYPFTEWVDVRLQTRHDELMELDQVPHGLERSIAIARELLHISMELEWRDNDPEIQASRRMEALMKRIGG